MHIQLEYYGFRIKPIKIGRKGKETFHNAPWTIPNVYTFADSIVYQNGRKCPRAQAELAKVWDLVGDIGVIDKRCALKALARLRKDNAKGAYAKRNSSFRVLQDRRYEFKLVHVILDRTEEAVEE